MPKVCSVCGEEFGAEDHETCRENERLLTRLWKDQPVVKALLQVLRAFEPFNA